MPRVRKTEDFRMRTSEPWKQWLIDFAKSCRSDMADLVDDALEAHARAKGYAIPPKR